MYTREILCVCLWFVLEPIFAYDDGSDEDYGKRKKKIYLPSQFSELNEFFDEEPKNWLNFDFMGYDNDSISDMSVSRIPKDIVLFHDDSETCRVSINKDFLDPAPIYIYNGQFMGPNTKKGEIWFNKSETLLVACVGDKRELIADNVTLNTSVEELNCVRDQTFYMPKLGWRGQFRNVRCNRNTQYSIQLTKEQCAGSNKLYKIGFEIRKKFHTLYKACFDKSTLSTVYVKHVVSPASAVIQTGGSRPKFSEGDFFGNIRMNDLYKIENQKIRLNELLGEYMSKTYITKNEYLTRGHLAPRADFPMKAAQRATFHIVNTAPQWRRGNAGDWAALEDAIRRRALSLNVTLVVYTGTYGVTTLRSRPGPHEEIYLANDENGNYLVPVPLYFYKVVYEPRSKGALAFVSINSPYYNQEMLQRLSFCTDICEGNLSYQWLRWRDDGTHSFCCAYEEFVNKINHLPSLDVRTNFH